MAWGFWNKIKKGLSSVGRWFKNKIFKPLGRTIKKVGKPMLNTAVKLAPVIGTAVGAKFGNPQIGAQIGGIVQQVGGALGYGK